MEFGISCTFLYKSGPLTAIALSELGLDPTEAELVDGLPVLELGSDFLPDFSFLSAFVVLSSACLFSAVLFSCKVFRLAKSGAIFVVN